MGRATQFFEYINSDKHPSALEQQCKYTHLTITEDVKKLRSEYRRQPQERNEMDNEIYSGVCQCGITHHHYAPSVAICPTCGGSVTLEKRGSTEAGAK